MDASCSIQENIHECLIVLFNDVSRKLGTYHFQQNIGIFLSDFSGYRGAILDPIGKKWNI